MYITFKNYTSSKMLISLGNQKISVNPESSVDVFHSGGKLEFEAQLNAFDELLEGIDEIDENDKNDSLKDRILTKLTKKAIKKIPEIVLNVAVRYEFNFAEGQSPVINLFEGAYSLFDGKLADAFDMPFIAMAFCRAETDCGQIRVIDVNALNRKKYLKLWRNILLFANWGFFLDLFFFLPEYLVAKIFSSHLFIKRIFISLYKKTPMERERILADKERKYEEEQAGCFIYLLKGIIILVAVFGILLWIGSGDPDVIISEDFSSVVCFDETFVKIYGGLPSDAEDVFLEDYTAYYPLAEGGYDTDNYYCRIYETPDGTRYMWIKDDCADVESSFKDYEDYENPLVYKSVGEQE